MLVCVFGTSTAFTYWTFGVAWHALQEVAPPVDRVHFAAIAEMREQWEKRSGRSTLLTTDYLEDDVSKMLIGLDAPIIVVVDPADVAIATAAKLRGLSFLDAIRHSSHYIVSLADLLAQESTVVFGVKARKALVRDFLPRLLRAMRLPDDPELVGAVFRRLAPDPAAWDALTVDEAVKASQPAISVEAVAADWSAREREAFRRVAEDYQRILDRLPLRQVTWPAAILHSQTVNYTTEKPLELIGPARPLIWGPYMHLPKGRWTAHMEFEVSENHSSNAVVAAVLLGDAFVSQGEFRLPVHGIFVWTLDFEVTDISKRIEVRLTLPRSAIEGAFFLREVRLSSAVAEA